MATQSFVWFSVTCVTFNAHLRLHIEACSWFDSSGILVWVPHSPGCLGLLRHVLLQHLSEAVSRVYPLEKPLWCRNLLDQRVFRTSCKGSILFFCEAMCSHCPLIECHRGEVTLLSNVTKERWHSWPPNVGGSCILSCGAANKLLIKTFNPIHNALALNLPRSGHNFLSCIWTLFSFNFCETDSLCSSTMVDVSNLAMLWCSV